MRHSALTRRLDVESARVWDIHYLARERQRADRNRRRMYERADFERRFSDQRLDARAPHEVLLVVDAGTGQNALNQARLFHETVGLTGLVLTKLDGTAKGGVAFALAQQARIPIRFVGIGEREEDLKPFCASDFVKALFDTASVADAARHQSGESA